MATAVAIALLSGFLPPTGLFSPDTFFVEEYSLGPFRQAARVSLSASGWLYVADQGANTIQLFGEDHSKSAEVGGYGWVSSTFDCPTGLATDGLSLYVSDRGNHRVQRFDRNLRYLSSLATRDTAYGPARFGYPLGVALSQQGALFVLDGENLRVVKFDASSNFERTFGDASSNNQAFRQPTKILATKQRVYISEPARILQFDDFGNFIRSVGENLGSRIQTFGADESAIVEVRGDSLYWFSVEGTLESTTSIRSLIADVPIDAVQDIAVAGDRLILLTTKHLISFHRVRQ